jgi:hypothetical protein
MRRFLEELEGSRSGDNLRLLEKQLLELFYKEVEASGDEFLQRYYGFERTLRMIITAINCRIYSFDTSKELWGEYEIIQKLMKGAASDFGLSEEYAFIPQLLDLAEMKDPMALDRQYDELLWDYVEELVKFSFFNTHKVLGYTVQLLMVYRWMRLSKEEGEKKLYAMVDEIMEQIVLPDLN